MTKYNTGNSVGSADPRDLYDTATVADKLVQGTEAAYPDRLGVSRRSWKSVEAQADQQATDFDADQADRAQRFNDFLASSGYEFAGDYAAGIEITEYNQIVRDTAGEFWRASGSTTLPYTTTGAGLPEGGAFVAVGDAVLRQELAASTVGQGSDLIAHTGTTESVTEALDKRTIYVGSVAELEGLSLPVGANVYLTEDGRAGEGVIKSGTPASDPQKGMNIVLANGFYWQRSNVTELTPEMFGAAVNATLGIQACLEFAEQSSIKAVRMTGTYRMAKAWEYGAAGVNESVAVKLRPGVTVNAKGAVFIYQGSAANDVLNQFHMFSNDPAEAAFGALEWQGGTFINDGTAGSYVNGLTIFGGDATKPLGWIDGIAISDTKADNIRALHKIHSDRPSDGGLPIKNVQITKIENKDCRSTTVYLVGVENFLVDGITCDGSDFDIVNVFSAKTGSINNIVGKNITENLLLIEGSGGQYSVSGVTVNSVVGDSGKITINTRDGSGGILEDIALSGIKCPAMLIDNVLGTGTVRNLSISGRAKPSGSSRGLYIGNCSNIKLDFEVRGSATLVCAEVQTSQNVTGRLVVNSDADVNCLRLDRAAGTNLELTARGGSNGVYLIGAQGSMGGARVLLNASGQSNRAVDYDGSTSASHRVTIQGFYDDQDVEYGDTEGSTVELQEGVGAVLVPAANEITVRSKTHYVSAGTVDNIPAGINGQRVTIFSTTASAVTFNHAATGGNIRTSTGAAVSATNVRPVELQYYGGRWCQV